MTILEEIISYKKREVLKQKKLFPYNYLEKSTFFKNKNKSLVEILKKSDSGIIAEHKRSSPSKKEINNNIPINKVIEGYDTAGVCGMSILTDKKFFSGSLKDLQEARNITELPILRKDFIIDIYQIVEAKAYGADLVLLIAAALSNKEIKVFSDFAKKLDLEVLLEIHSINELKNSLTPSIDIVGVNNRNLKTFEVDINISKKLSDQIPKDFIKISESGINKPSSVVELKKYGYKGFLVGENFMKTNDPGKSASKFIKKIKNEN